MENERISYMDQSLKLFVGIGLRETVGFRPLHFRHVTCRACGPMRIRIISPHPGEVDGIPLSVFQAGLAYDVSSILATYLITMGCAEAVIDDNPRPVTPLPDLPEDIAVQVQNRQQSRRMNKGMAGESLDRSGR